MSHSKDKLNLSVVVLAKNEASNLDFCLKSIKPIAREIIVCDTGSMDSTPSIALQNGSILIRKCLRKDFASLKNYLIKQAQSEWILFLDADRSIAKTDQYKISSLLTRSHCHAYRLNVVNYGRPIDINFYDNWQPCVGRYSREEKFSKSKSFYTSTSICLFRKMDAIHFEYPIHESVYPSLERNRLLLRKADINIHHYEMSRGFKHHLSKHKTYASILKVACKKYPAASILYKHLAFDVVASSHAADTIIKSIKQAIRHNPGDFELKRLMGSVYIRHLKTRQARKFLFESLKISKSAATLLLIAQTYIMENKNTEAYFYAKKSLSQKKVNPLALNILSAVYVQRKDLKSALECLLHSEKIYDCHYDTLLNLSRIYEAIGNYKLAEIYKHKARLLQDKFLENEKA